MGRTPVIDQRLSPQAYLVLQKIGPHRGSDGELLVARRIHLPIDDGHAALSPSTHQAQPSPLTTLQTQQEPTRQLAGTLKLVSKVTERNPVERSRIQPLQLSFMYQSFSISDELTCHRRLHSPTI